MHETDEKHTPAPETRRQRGPLNRTARYLHDLVADADTLANCPRADRNHAARLAWLAVTIRLFYIPLVFFSLTVAFGYSLISIVACLCSAVVVGAIYYHFDLLMVRASWFRHGTRALKRRIQLGQGRYGEGFSEWGLLALRGGVSCAAGCMFATLFALAWFHASVLEEVKVLFRHAHIAQYQSITNSIDGKERIFRQIIKEQTASLKADENEKAALLMLPGNGSDPPGDTQHSQITMLIKRIDDLQTRISSVQRERDQQQYLMICEEAGEKGDAYHCPDATSIPGKKRHYIAANQRRDADDQALNELRQELEAAHTSLRDLQAHARDRLDALTMQEGTTKKTLADAQTALEDLLATRSDTIDQKVQSIIPMSQGPAQQLNALFHLADDNRGVSALWLGLELLIVLTELLAVFAASSIDPRGTYCIRVAEQYHTTVIEAARRLVELSQATEAATTSAAVRSRLPRTPPDDEATVAANDEDPRPLPPGGASAHQPPELSSGKDGLTQGTPGVREPDRVRLRALGFSSDEIHRMTSAAAEALVSQLSVLEQKQRATALGQMSEESTDGSTSLHSRDASSVRIPFMITRAQKNRLQHLGYSETEIADMKPDVAHSLLFPAAE
jgi:Domain of unknown function (DUF4407)